MSEGLITRLGQWIDQKWATKATEKQLFGLRDDVLARWALSEMALKKAITDIEVVARTPEVYEKLIADLTTRIEKLELGTGMYRKVDPTKAPVAKSAFQM